MKKLLIITLAACILWAGAAMGQAPEKFNYQGIARNATGTPLASSSISLRISILNGSAAGAVVYAESHSVTTNAFGLYNVAIGAGTVLSGNMSTIAWGSGSKFMKVEIDPAGGVAFTTVGNTELLSVP